MKKIVLTIILITFILFGSASVHAVYVNGYYRSNGTYVNSYYRSSPNALRYDNYSYKSYQPRYNNSYYSGYYSSPRQYQPAWTYEDDYWTGYDSYNSEY